MQGSAKISNERTALLRTQLKVGCQVSGQKRGSAEVLVVRTASFPSCGSVHSCPAASGVVHHHDSVIFALACPPNVHARM